MKWTLALITSLILGSLSHANLLTTTESGPAKEGITTSLKATFQPSPQTGAQELYSLGSGVRKKKVLVTLVKVYLAELLVSQPESFVRTEEAALGSLANNQTFAVKLTFLRAVSSDKIMTAFKDALSANAVDLNSPEISALLSFVSQGGDTTDGSEMIFAGVKNADQTETLYFVGANQVVQQVIAPAGASQKVLSMWLGVASDNELNILKKQILSGN